MPRYAMVIKTNLCTGCQTCSVACKMENMTLPGCARTSITEQMTGAWEVALCNQCENPPCVSVCPADATWKNEVGVIIIDQEKCTGCGECLTACPYAARHINPKQGYFKEDLAFEKMVKKVGEKHRIRLAGKADKCDFCMSRIQNNRDPMCVESCTTNARVFGDMDDPKSEASRLVAKGAKTLKPELGTKPKVFYI
jgi:Fe-S-cluster-containing dehydrogenase component